MPIGRTAEEELLAAEVRELERMGEMPCTVFGIVPGIVLCVGRVIKSAGRGAGLPSFECLLCS